MKFILLLISLISFTSLHAQLSGTYTINPNKPADSLNYQSFEAAIGDLESGVRSDSATANGKGISGNVVFLIADGIYKTRISIDQIIGTSDTSRIFFRSASKDSSKVILTYPSSSSDSANYVLHLRYTYYLNFSHLTFHRTGKESYGNVVYFNEGMYNTFTNCVVKGVLNSNSGPRASAFYIEGEDQSSFFDNLYIDSAEYGFFYYGSSGPSRKNRIENCTFNHIGEVGISLIDQDSVIIKNNVIYNIIDEFGSGIKLYRCFNPQIIGNKITLQNGGYGIDDYETARKSTARGLIANNMISVTGGRWASGMYFYNTEYMDLINNSIFVGDSTGQDRIPLVIADASTTSRHQRIFNNILATNSGGVAIYVGKYSHNNFDSLGYNNYYSSGEYFGAWEGSFSAAKYKAPVSTSGWQSLVTDKKSTSTNPHFYSATNLHAEAVLIDGKAKPWPGIKTDIDGNLRNTKTPDIGADEFKSISSDIKLLEIFKPIAGKCEDTSDLKIKLSNNGIDSLKKLSVLWKVNGQIKDTFTKAVKLASGQDLTLAIGRISWPVNSFDKVTVAVFDTADKNQRNDTVSLSYRKGLEGNFTLGTDSSDYPDFTSALQDLYKYGVCGDVTFNIADGKYNQKIELLPVPGAGKLSRITFRSASGDSTKVIITKASEFSDADNFVLSFNGADYFNFENVTISRSGNYYYGQAVLLYNKSTHNSLKNCIIEAGKSSDNNSWNLTDKGFGNDSNIIENNIFRFGNGPILLGKIPVSSSTSTKSYGNIIKNNVFDSSYATGLKLLYQERLQLIGNTFVSKQSGFDTVFYLKLCNHHVNISNNYIHLNQGGQGIILEECYAGYYTFSSVNNNMIIIGGNTNQVVNGVQLLLTGYIHINYNSIRIDTGSHVYSSALFFGINTGTPIYPGHRVFNNILINESQGYTIWASSHTNSRQMIDSSDNNVFYSGKTNHILFNGANSGSISGWNSFSGNDNKSIFLKPTFTNKDSLFTYDYRINGKGTPINYISTDIESDKRNSSKPDIGADEFELPKDDAYLISVTEPAGTPCKGFHDLKIKVRNMGTDTLKSLVIGYKTDYVFTDTSSFKISLVSYKDTVLKLGKVYFGDSVRWFTIYTMFTNNTPEVNRGNDTLKIALRASFNGTYTIGDNTYYPSFKKAIHHLDSFGVCGPVVFKIKNGKYNERLLFKNIKGSNRTNNITFESISGDSSKVIIWTGPIQTSWDSNYVVLLDGAHDITFKKITLGRQINISDGKAIELRNNAARLQFLNCQLEGARYADKFSHVINTSQDCDSIVVKRSRLKYGYNGINFKGLGQSNRIQHVIIEDNIFDSIQVINISMEHVKGLYVRQNKMLFGNMALNLSDIDSDLTIERNKIHSKDAIAISITGAVFTKSNPGRIVNNMVIVEGKYNVTGIRIISALYMDILHNSVKVISPWDESVPLAVISYSNSYYGHRVINNILTNTGPGHAIYFRPSTAAITIPYSDYNALYTNGKYIGREDVINYATSKDWVKALKTDSHSISVLPVFVDSFDLHVLGSNVDGKAKPLTTLKTDIDNQARSASMPDIGADEFNPYSHDIAIKSIFPASNICGDTATRFAVVIENQGGNSETSFKVNLNASGSVITSLDTVYKKVLYPAQIDTVYFSKTFNTVKGGNYNFIAWHSLSGDVVRVNDTLKNKIQIQTRENAPIVKDTSVCAGTDLILKPGKSTGAALLWYKTANSNSSFFSADSLSVKKIYKDTFFYVSSLLSSSCESYRKLIKVKVFQKPQKASFTKGGYFHGIFNTGTSSDPDKICEGSVSEYFIQAPATFSDKDHGKIWKISNLYIKNLNNSNAFEDTTVTWPSGAGSGVIQFKPSADGFKKSLQLTITIADLKTGCDTVFERYLEVIPLPEVKWSVSRICEGETVNFTDSSTNAATYSWQFGNGNTSTLQHPSNKYLKAGTYMVTLKVNNSTGCTDSLVKTVIVHPIPKADFKIPATVCLGEEFTPSNLTTFHAGLSYTWDFGDKTTSTDSAAKHAYTSAGTYIIKLTATSAFGCSKSISRTIKVYDKPSTDFTAVDSVCVGKNVFFRNFTLNASSYSWKFSTGDTFTTKNVNYTFDSAGNFNVRLISFNLNGCSDTFIKNIIILPIPKPDFEAQNVCIGDSITFINKSNVHGQSGISYIWKFGDGKSSSLENPNHLYAKEGNYDVTLVVTGLGSCTDSIQKKVIVGSNPDALFYYTGTCVNSDFIFADQSTSKTSKITSRNWDFGDGTSSSDSLVNHSYKSAGKYTVTLYVTSEYGCRNFITDTIEVYDLPDANFTRDTVCAGEATSFTNKSTDNALNFWYFGDGDTSTALDPQHVYKTGGKYDVLLIVRSSSGCTDSITQTIDVPEIPSAEFTYSITGGSVSFMANDTLLPAYYWDFGDGDTSISKNPTHIYDSNGVYTVKLWAINASGCIDSVSKQIQITSVGIDFAENTSAGLSIFPNPFKNNFTVQFDLENAGMVSLRLLDIKGREILSRNFGMQPAGRFSTHIQTDVSAGPYTIQLLVNKKIVTKKIISVK